jgi:hypothetical protein
VANVALQEYTQRWVDAVVQMTKLTIEKKMVWRSVDSLGVDDKDPRADVFEAEYKGKKYRLFVHDFGAVEWNGCVK